MLTWLAHLPSPAKRALLVAADSFISVFSLWAALSLRLEQWVSPGAKWWPLLVAAPLAAMAVFMRSGLYRAVIRRLTLEAVGTAALAVSLAVALWGIAALFLAIDGLPRSVVLIYGLIFFVLIVGSRLIMYRLFLARSRYQARTPVAIYGAGTEGMQLALMLMNSDSGCRPRFFLDENDDLQGREVAGLPVYPPSALARLIESDAVEEMLVSVYSDDAERRLRVLDFLSAYPLRTKVLPPMREWMRGPMDPGRLDRIEIEDLLGREPVAPDRALLEEGVRGHCIVVTGAGGSIGSQLCERLLELGAGRLILVEQSEYALFEIGKRIGEMADVGATDVVALLGSVEDAAFVRDVFAAWPVDVVYHAAAYKHVPIVEDNVAAGVANNLFGTRTVAVAAREAAVARFVLISTDKAVCPTSVMGASKRLAEMVLQTMATEPGATCFSIVRFGNVLGSSGSVIPLFREQIDRRLAVTVTHPQAERYFMTVREAAELVIQAGMLAASGDVFVLDMGEPVKIAEVARKMIYLSGLRAQENDDEPGDISIRYTGLRPGEKLREELLSGGAETTSHPKILRAMEACPQPRQLESLLCEFERALRDRDATLLRRLLLRAVPSFRGDEAPPRDTE